MTNLEQFIVINMTCSLIVNRFKLETQPHISVLGYRLLLNYFILEAFLHLKRNTLPNCHFKTFMLNQRQASLTHISKAPFLWDIGKQCRTRSDTCHLTKCSYICLLTKCYFRIRIKNEKYHPTGPVQLIIVGNSFRLKCVNHYF